MRPKWPKLASLAPKICTLWFQFFHAFFASKGYPFKNIFIVFQMSCYCKCSMARPHCVMGLSAVCDYLYFLIILTYILQPV